MLHNTSLIVWLALAALTAGCSSAPAPLPDTRAADLQAVKDVETAWLKDASSKSGEKWASYFTEDGSGLYPGSGILNGKELSAQRWRRFFPIRISRWISTPRKPWRPKAVIWSIRRASIP